MPPLAAPVDGALLSTSLPTAPLGGKAQLEARTLRAAFNHHRVINIGANQAVNAGSGIKVRTHGQHHRPVAFLFNGTGDLLMFDGNIQGNSPSRLKSQTAPITVSGSINTSALNSNAQRIQIEAGGQLTTGAITASASSAHC